MNETTDTEQATPTPQETEAQLLAADRQHASRALRRLRETRDALASQLKAIDADIEHFVRELAIDQQVATADSVQLNGKD